MTDDAAAVRARADAALEAGLALGARPFEERARWLARAADSFRVDSELGQEARTQLPDATGLSEEMVDWGLRTTFETIDGDTLLGLAKEARSASTPGAAAHRLVSVVLAGNVFTASVRAVFVPLLMGSAVLVKASSKETRFPTLLRKALISTDPTLGEAMQVVSFAGGEPEPERALVERAGLVSVYGGDAAVAAIQRRVSGDVPVAPHGHGVSVAYCSARSAEGPRARASAQDLALDVAAYDQRGCLSPSIVYVEGDVRVAEDFAEHLSSALEALEHTLPRGPLPDAVASAQVQWRGLAMVDGVLVRGPTHAVAVRPLGPPRWSPGYRNVVLVPVRGLDEAFEAMHAYADHLKCLGCSDDVRRDVRDRLAERPTWDAYPTVLGTMQTPALDAPQDGRPIWTGHLRSRP